MPEQTPPTSDTLPPLALVNLMSQFILIRAIHVAAQFRIADVLRDGPKSTAELAEATGTQEPSLYRLLRVLASARIFSEIEPRRFAHTPLSLFLRSDVPGSVHALTLMWGSDWGWKIWGELAYSVKTGEPAFDRLFGMDLWQYFTQVNPEAGRIFSKAMTEFTEPLNGAIAAAYDFSPLGVGTVVDVGGGEGSFLSLLLSSEREMKGILFDRRDVLEAARERFAADGLDGRCELVAGDFFVSVPAGGDAYILKQVLHDWDDNQCIQILSNCRRAMRSGGVVLVVELMIPEGNQPSFAKLLDLQMLVELRGRERTESEFRDLYQRAGFELTRVIPTSAPHSIIEGRAV